MGDHTKDSNVSRQSNDDDVFLIARFTLQGASVEELEERPAASWIRRQMGIFTPARRDVRSARLPAGRYVRQRLILVSRKVNQNLVPPS